MTVAGTLRRMIVAARTPPLEQSGGLPFDALYPAAPPPAIARPAIAPTRIRFVAAIAGGAILALANPDRRSLTVVNTSTGSMYVKLGRGATATSLGYSLIVPSGASVQLEPPDVYLGDVSAAWATIDGGAEITEL